MTQTIYINSDTILVDERHSKKQYGNWSKTYEFKLESASLTDFKNGGDTFTVDFEVVDGDTIYVLYVIYNDGDSFGKATGKGEVIWVFKDYQVAETAAKVWEKNEDAFQITIVTEAGKSLELYNVAADYFARITDIVIEPLIINQGSYRKKLR